MKTICGSAILPADFNSIIVRATDWVRKNGPPEVVRQYVIPALGCSFQKIKSFARSDARVVDPQVNAFKTLERLLEKPASLSFDISHVYARLETARGDPRISASMAC